MAKVATTPLFTNATTAPWPLVPVENVAGTKTYSFWGGSSTAGAASVNIEGSSNDGASWSLIGTISLTLGATVTEDSFISNDRYKLVRGNLQSMSGTNAVVSAAMGF